MDHSSDNKCVQGYIHVLYQYRSIGIIPSPAGINLNIVYAKINRDVRGKGCAKPGVSYSKLEYLTIINKSLVTRFRENITSFTGIYDISHFQLLDTLYTRYIKLKSHLGCYEKTKITSFLHSIGYLIPCRYH